MTAAGQPVATRYVWARPYLPARVVVDLVLLATAVAAWASSLSFTDVDRVGEFGLLATVHPLFFVAPVLCIGGFVATIVGGVRRPAVLVAYLVVVILIIHASTPLLLSDPQYAWTYKHVGAVELFAERGSASSPDDVYQQWPAFLAGVAQLTSVSGVTALDLAPWAPVFFNLAASVLLFAVTRALSPDRRTPFLTVLLFQCINSIEQDYLAPQGLAFLLSLGLMLIVVRWLRGQPYASPAAAPTPSRRGRVAALSALVLIMATLAATHPLSPLLVAGAVVTLVLLGVVRPWWTALVVVAIPALYVLTKLDVVSTSFGRLDGFELFHGAVNDDQSWATAGQAFSAHTVRGLALAMWFLALLAAFRDRRSIRRVLAPLTLAFLPFVLVFAHSHGGEAIYRVYVFSAPWCAFLIADMAVQIRWPRAVRATLAIVTIVAMLLATIQGRHGQLEVDRQTAAEVAAARYLYDHGRPGAAVILATPNFPARLAANYGEFNPGLANDPDLVTGAHLTAVMLNDAYLAQIETFVTSFPGTTSYLVISDGMRRYARYFGWLPEGSLDTLETTLAAAARWTVFYRNSDVVIYELDG